MVHVWAEVGCDKVDTSGIAINGNLGVEVLSSSMIVGCTCYNSMISFKVDGSVAYGNAWRI